MAKQKAPNSGWKGPVQCISVSSTKHDGVAELCGQNLRRSVQWPKFLELARPPSENSTACSTCEVEVACGASEKLANLVDGVMHVLPTNQSTHGVCIEPGHSFEGYYRPARLVDPKDKEKMEVEPRSRIDAERHTHEMLQMMAPIFAGSGGTIIVAIVAYVIYSTWYRLVGSNQYSPLPKECLGPSPTWRSEFAMIQGSIECEGKAALPQEDVCRVCLSAACGDVVFVGCGHAVVCLTCSSLLRECPVCGDPVEGVRIEEALLL